MGVDSAVVYLSVVLSTPMNVIWRICEPLLYNRVSSPTLSLRDDKQETGICGLSDCHFRRTRFNDGSEKIGAGNR